MKGLHPVKITDFDMTVWLDSLGLTPCDFQTIFKVLASPLTSHQKRLFAV